MYRIIYFPLFLLVLSGCNSPQESANSSESSAPPNVLFIAVDDLNDWLGCMKGHPNAKTPNMDRLAAMGTLFTNAHCQTPLCGPSRASLMSGLRPSTTGIYGQINDKDIRGANPATKSCTFLPEYFGQQGYKTLGVGKLFHKFAPEGVFEEEGGREVGFGPKPEKRFKYDPEWFGKPKGTQTDWGAFPETDEEMPDYRTAQWAIERINQPHDRPFFLAVGFLRPHVPWYVPQKWFDLHPIDEIQLPPYLKDDQSDVPEISRKVHDAPPMPTAEWMEENNEWKNVVQAYLACISFVDHYVGEVLNALEKSPHVDNTVIVLWSDHGYHIGEKNRFAKHSLWEEATHVPLIIAGNGLPNNQICSKSVELLDLYPTLLELCGLPANSQNEGESIFPLLQNPNQQWPHPAITTYGRKNHSLRTETDRYSLFEDGSEEWYHHPADPNEWENVAGGPIHTDQKANLLPFFPDSNAHWTERSQMTINPYFVGQKTRKRVGQKPHL